MEILPAARRNSRVGVEVHVFVSNQTQDHYFNKDFTQLHNKVVFIIRSCVSKQRNFANGSRLHLFLAQVPSICFMFILCSHKWAIHVYRGFVFPTRIWREGPKWKIMWIFVDADMFCEMMTKSVFRVISPTTFGSIMMRNVCTSQRMPPGNRCALPEPPPFPLHPPRPVYIGYQFSSHYVATRSQSVFRSAGPWKGFSRRSAAPDRRQHWYPPIAQTNTLQLGERYVYRTYNTNIILYLYI